MSKELDREYWHKLDAQLLADEAILEEQKRWLEIDVFEVIGRIGLTAFLEIVIESPLL